MGITAAVLRRLIRTNDRAQLQEYIRCGQVDPVLCRRLLMEDAPRDTALRLLLIQGSCDHPLDTFDPDSNRSHDPGTDQTLRQLSLQNAFLRIPLSRMQVIETNRTLAFGTDGRNFFLSSADSPIPAAEDYQHMVIHCLFGHIRIPADAIPLCWDTAADFSAEYLRTRIFPTSEPRTDRTYDLLAPTLSRFPRSLYPGNIRDVYCWFQENLSREQLAELATRVCRDDHALWNTPIRELYPDGGDGGSDGAGDMEQMWTDALAAVRSETHASRRGFAPGSHREKILLREEAKHDFRRYLRRFAVIREEVQLDTESFDYIPYCFGLETYGNMPLLEPLEYTEAFKVEQLVIAIDTSGSRDTEVVRRFLTEVHGILTTHEHFFKRMEVHIIQCDSAIHEHIVIHSTEEWADYIDNITIRGRGGTDFTPVFRLIEKLQSARQLQNLKGLLYFTDGDGIYPQTKPPYETAFIFSRSDFMQYNPPSWCVALCMDDTSAERI